MDQYKWFYDSTYSKSLCLDKCNTFASKIGISPDGSTMNSNGLIFPLSKYRNVNKNINGKKILDVIYKINEQTDFIFHNRFNLLTYRFIEIGNDMKFNFIEYNGKQYKLLNH
jgi:hypothetical protein